MRIELLMDDGEEILLSPVKKNEGGNKIIYQLINDQNESLMELEMVNNSFVVLSQNPKVKEEEANLRIKLDQLVLSVIESEQSGTENTETEADEANPYNPDDIKVHSKQFSIKLIYEMIESGDIDLNPDFQRNFVWNSMQKSRLIESILLRIPLPMFYFAEDEEGKISVVDGLQRLTTIKDFMDNKFSLKKLEYLQESCEGKFYSAKNNDGRPNNKKVIDPKYFRWFNMTQFSVNVIDPNSPSKVKYDIFRRINTGGKPLNNQEIRNSLSGKGLRDTLQKMTNLPEFASATDHSIKSTRMDDHEVALRFILFSRFLETGKNIHEYNGYMDSSLDNLTEDLQKIKGEALERYVNLFSNAMKNAEYLFGSKYAFRKVMPPDLEPGAGKQLINKALFVSWSVLLANLDNNTIKEKNIEGSLLLPLATEINVDIQLRMFLSYGTNSRANLLYVFEKVEKLINVHLIF